MQRHLCSFVSLSIHINKYLEQEYLLVLFPKRCCFGKFVPLLRVKRRIRILGFYCTCSNSRVQIIFPEILSTLN